MPEKVLLTGANGFIASHILQILFSRGYDVVGTVRTPAKGDFIVKKHPKFEYEIVTNLTELDAFDEVFKAHPDITYVIHTVSPVDFAESDFENKVITPAINGTLAILKGAQKYGPNVKKVVTTSSMAAVVLPLQLNDPTCTFNEESWNPITRELAVTNPLYAYLGSKTFAERAAWDFVKENDVPFKLSTVIFPYAYGALLQDVTISSLNYTSQKLFSYIGGQGPPVDLEEFNPFIHVHDAALTHVIAMTEPGLDGKRVLSIGGEGNGQLFADTLRKLRPDLDSVIPVGNPGSYDPAKYAKIDNSVSEKYLKIKYKSLEEALTDSVSGLLELKNKAAA